MRLPVLKEFANQLKNLLATFCTRWRFVYRTHSRFRAKCSATSVNEIHHKLSGEQIKTE